MYVILVNKKNLNASFSPPLNMKSKVTLEHRKSVNFKEEKEALRLPLSRGGLPTWISEAVKSHNYILQSTQDLLEITDGRPPP